MDTRTRKYLGLLNGVAYSASPRYPPAYHGTSPLLAESIHRNGLMPNNGHVFLTPSKNLALSFACWATASVMAGGDPAPLPELCTTEVGRAVAEAYERGGSNLAAVCKVEIPLSVPLELVHNTGAPALPWEDEPHHAPVVRLNEHVDPSWIVGWEFFRIPELLEPGMLERVTGEAARLAHEYPRDPHGLLEDVTPEPIGAEVPNARRLVAAILEAASPELPTFSFHSPAHWFRVARYGHQLLTPDVDPLVVLLFALLHDCQRRTDGGDDPEHGPRAAELARTLNGSAFTLDAERLDVLCRAIEDHSNGGVSDHPTIGACWDSDRLEIARYGWQRDPSLLSTVRGRELAFQTPDATPAPTPEAMFDAYRQTLAGAS